MLGHKSWTIIIWNERKRLNYYETEGLYNKKQTRTITVSEKTIATLIAIRE